MFTFLSLHCIVLFLYWTNLRGFQPHTEHTACLTSLLFLQVTWGITRFDVLFDPRGFKVFELLKSFHFLFFWHSTQIHVHKQNPISTSPINPPPHIHPLLQSVSGRLLVAACCIFNAFLLSQLCMMNVWFTLPWPWENMVQAHTHQATKALGESLSKMTIKDASASLDNSHLSAQVGQVLYLIN